MIRRIGLSIPLIVALSCVTQTQRAARPPALQLPDHILFLVYSENATAFVPGVTVSALLSDGHESLIGKSDPDGQLLLATKRLRQLEPRYLLFCLAGLPQCTALPVASLKLSDPTFSDCLVNLPPVAIP